MQALSIRNLTKVYRGNVHALSGVDLDVDQGEFFGLLGPNGAGKTTLIGIVTSLVTKTEGHVEIFGHDLDTDLEGAKACIGVVPQEINFNQFEKVSDIVINQAGYYGVPRALARRRAETYLRQLSLWDKREATSRNLSGGMKRRLMIARALMHEPRLLILDEPTAGVDIEVRRSMWAFLRRINQAGTSIILTTHYLEEAESLCRRIGIIDHGHIVEIGGTSELLGTLSTETFVLNLREPMRWPPQLDGYPVQQLDATTLEVEVDRTHNVTGLFELLSRQNLQVLSLRNKVNRLEELFIRLTEGEAR